MGILYIVGLTATVVLALAHHALANAQYGVTVYNGNQNINSPQIIVNINGNRGSGGKCMYEVIGRGVDDNILEDCPNTNGWNQINTDNYYTYFYPKYNPLGFYTDTRGTLVIVKGSGCRLRKYQATSGKVTFTESVLSNEICEKIKKKIDDQIVAVVDYWAKWKVNFKRKMANLPPLYDIVDPLKDQPPTASLYGGQPGDRTSTYSGTQSVNSKSIKVSTSFPKSSSGCKVEISLLGKGVQDKFTEPCSDKPAESVSTEDVFIFGDPKVNSFSLYSDEPKILYVIKNKTCTKRTYTTDAKGVTESKINIMKIIKCNEIKKTISDTLAIHKSKPSLSTSKSPLPEVTPAVSSDEDVFF